MSVTIQIHDYPQPIVGAAESIRSTARAIAAKNYGDELRSMALVDDGSLYPVLNRYRAELVRIDENYANSH